MRFLNKYVFFNLLMLLSFNIFAVVFNKVEVANDLRISWSYNGMAHYFSTIWRGSDENGNTYHIISEGSARNIGITEDTHISEIYFDTRYGRVITVNFRPHQSVREDYSSERIRLHRRELFVQWFDPYNQEIWIQMPMYILAPYDFDSPGTPPTPSAESSSECSCLESDSLSSH